MSHPDDRPLFQEEQAFTQWWLWAIVLLVAAVSWWNFLQQIVWRVPFGTNPAPDGVVWALFVLCGFALPLFFFWSRLVTTVTPDLLRVHLRLLRRREIPLATIRSASSVEFRPLREYGGWGIRYNRSLGWAYTARGRRGVRLRLGDGKGFLVGSQRPDELLAALLEAGVAPAPPREA